MSATAKVTPVLVYEDIEAGHDYLVEVFGFTSGGQLQRMKDGTVVHGEVAHGDQVIWLHRAAPDQGLASPHTLAASHSGLSIQLPDVDEHFARTKGAGAQIDSEPMDQPYGLREYGARDPEGHRWWFYTPLT